MKFLLPLILLLILSCEEVLESIKEGCTTATACNYDATAMKDDGSCIAKQGCNEWCEGDSLTVQEFDCAGVCGGNTKQEYCNACTSQIFDWSHGAVTVNLSFSGFALATRKGKSFIKLTFL